MNMHTTPVAGRSASFHGILLMLLGILLFSINDVMGKWLVATYSVGQVLLLRSAAALVVLTAAIWYRGERLYFPSAPGLYILRIVFSTLEVACFYWAVMWLPLADVMTCYLAAPIYVAAIAAVWLKERIDLLRVSVIAVGFVGVVLALRPSSETLTLPVTVALVGSLCFALLMITTRRLRDTSGTSLVLGQTLGALVFGAIASPFGWVSPSSLDFVLLSLLGLIAMTGHICVNRSLRLAPASVVAPFQYTLIVWAIILGYLVFGDIAELWTIIGAAVICGAGVALIVIERRARRAIAASPPSPAPSGQPFPSAET
ncbi:DMT family transporter [Microvirga massiliensis]|uniref:DMT family transporter n=1 Tax=Microvirga massiliensis TaxID=1033741 RepID=UPI00062B32A7|nr:DMT family transporter [Microvirga massiliensis]